jgi:tRNA pseudouridine38-40 synthase
LTLAYDGATFSGFAAQNNTARTVAATLKTAILAMDPTAGGLRVASRTDAGVHARGQVAHADVDAADWATVPGRSDRSPADALRSRLAGVLPADITVSRVGAAAAGFDARFSATSRRYLYRLADDLAAHDPLRRRDTVAVRGHLDPHAMSEAAYLLVGLHDFAAFCKQREGATTVRTLLGLSWERGPDGVVVGTVVADAFCHSMVRSLVGALVPVGEGRRDVDWPAEVLTGGVRDPGVRVMPPHGLSLEEVSYPPDAELAARALETRATRIPE